MDFRGASQQFFRRAGDATRDIVTVREGRRDEADGFEDIRCPHCRWHPRPSDQWMCVATGAPEFFSDGCWTAWNTFATHGRCPGCSHQWKWTHCLKCTGWSLHDDWYELPRENSFLRTPH